MRQLMFSRFALVLMVTVAIAGGKSVFKNLTLPQAVAAAQIAHQPVVVKFYTTWCGYCKAMDKNTFHNSEVRATLDNYIPIEVDIESPPGRALAEKYRIHGTPTIAIFNETGDLISIHPGYQDAETFLTYLAQTDVAKKH